MGVLKKPDYGVCLKLLKNNFALVAIGSEKRANYKWEGTLKNPNLKPLSEAEFKKRYYYDGSYNFTKKDKNGNDIVVNFPKTEGVGIITGYDNLEVIDVDTKILSTLKEKQDFWNEYLELLENHVEDFHNKVAIYETVSGGYHLLYKCSEIEPNKDLASPKGVEGQLIETRGIGGYVFIYDKQISNLSYFTIKEISTDDRNMIFECSKFYHFIEDKKESTTPKKTNTEFEEQDIKTWDDYRLKNNILDVISDDFDEVGVLSGKVKILRKGAKSAHSGYVDTTLNKMYLFSTGTIYPHQTPLNPFDVYRIKYCNGDYGKAASQLYKDGYGSRIIIKPILLESEIKQDAKIDFPLDIFPKDFQIYITENNRVLGHSIDYMANSLLWVMSTIIGNSEVIMAKNGYVQSASLWLALVGAAGVGKTPSISAITRPLEKLNGKEIKKYIKDLAKFQDYTKKSKEEKETSETLRDPLKAQFLVNDITQEALIELHQMNPNSIGVLKDELAGWIKDMNKYRAGSDKEFWLSTWSSTPIYLNRKTAASSYVEKPFIPILGGIQPSIFTEFSTDENKDNGFLDRLLLCFPQEKINHYIEEEIDLQLLQWYEDVIVNIYNSQKKQCKFDDSGEIMPLVIKLSDSGRSEFKNIYNEITDKQNSDSINEYTKSMLPKQKNYVLRFSLILNFIWRQTSDENYSKEIGSDILLKSKKLSDYFIKMSNKVKIDSDEVLNIKKSIKSFDGDIDLIIKNLIKENKSINQSQLANDLGVTRQTIARKIKKWKR